MGQAPAIARYDRPPFFLALGLWGFCIMGQAGALWTLSGDTFDRMIAFPPIVTMSGLLLTGVLHLAAKRIESSTKGWLALAGAVLAVTMAQAVIDHGIWMLCREGRRPLQREIAGVMLNFLTYIWLYGLYATALKLLSAQALATERERRLAAAQTLAQKARLDALRFQLNPHFLFNSLNALSGLIVTGRPRQADEMVVKLATFLRSTLETQDQTLHTLAQELATADAYLDIERIRFGGLRPVIDCPDHLLDVLVPDLILQPLLENAVKYAVNPSNGQAQVRIEVRGIDELLEISVIDDGAAEATPLAGHGIGLVNIRHRLAALYGDQASLIAQARSRGYCATLRLPLRRTAHQSAAQASVLTPKPNPPRSGSNRR